MDLGAIVKNHARGRVVFLVKSENDIDNTFNELKPISTGTHVFKRADDQVVALVFRSPEDRENEFRLPDGYTIHALKTNSSKLAAADVMALWNLIVKAECKSNIQQKVFTTDNATPTVEIPDIEEALVLSK